MYNNDLHNQNVQWDGSSYSTTNYRVEDAPQGSSSPTPPKQKKPRKGAAKAVALVLCCALLGGAAGIGGAAIYDYVSSSNRAGRHGAQHHGQRAEHSARRAHVSV